MEHTQEVNSLEATEVAVVAAPFKIEFVNVYDENDDDLVLAMNCSNG